MKTVATILAGGKSRRMGRDKALLPVDGRPLLAVQAERWRDVFDALVISADTRERFAALELGGARIVEDTRPGAGPMAGLEAVMRAVPAERYFLTAVDLPFGSPGLARELDRRMGDAGACLIRREGRGWEPLFALYARSCLPAISAALDRGERSFYRGLLPAVKVREIPEKSLPGFPLDRLLLNANTPEEWTVSQYLSKKNTSNDSKLDSTRI